MAGVIVLFVFQIFLLGFTSANCDIPCSECKEFSSGPYQGIWSLIERNSPSCPPINNGKMCLYQNIENATLMCFCDPGTESYTKCGGCPVGVEYNDMCYISVDTPKTWLDAKEDCKSRGGDLASIKNADVNSFVANLVGPRTWIGATDAETEGVWKWTNGDVVKWTNWGPENPDNYLGNQHCATINYQTTGHWDDDGCTVEHPYICQINKEWVNGLCYNDTAFPWIEKNFIYLSNNSIENCRAACQNNFPKTFFYGVEDANLCFCGTIEQPTPHHLRVNQSFCNQACPGNNLELCGAENMINLYASNPFIEHPENGLCYNDTSYPWIEQYFIYLPKNNSISNCRDACISTYPTSTHFGLEDGNLCACGTEPQPTKQHLQVAQTLCNMPCSANPNPSEFCGGNNMTNLWRIYPLY